MKKDAKGKNQILWLEEKVSGQMNSPIDCATIDPRSKTYFAVRLGSSDDLDNMPGIIFLSISF